MPPQVAVKEMRGISRDSNSPLKRGPGPQPPFQGGALDQTHLSFPQLAILSPRSDVAPSTYSDSQLELITFFRGAVLRTDEKTTTGFGNGSINSFGIARRLHTASMKASRSLLELRLHSQNSAFIFPSALSLEFRHSSCSTNPVQKGIGNFYGTLTTTGFAEITFGP